MASITEVSDASSPRSLDAVSAAWLTARLQAHGVDAEVASFRPEGLGEVHGLLAELQRLHLAYGRGDGPKSLIIKFWAASEQNREVGLRFGVYRRELLFYRDAAAATGMALPVVYAAEIDDDDAFVLLMEDLGHLRTGDQAAGCSVTDAEACMDELVKLHSTYWNSVDGPEFDFAPHVNGPVNGDPLCQAAEACWPLMLEKIGHAVPAEMQTAGPSIVAAFAAMQAHLGTAPITLIHSDFRLDNLMLGTRPEDPKVVTLDWQGALRGRGIQDVAFFLSQNLEVELRRANERALVERWRTGLAAHGIDAGTADEVWADYRRAVLYCWLYPIVIAGSLDATSERGTQMTVAMVARSAAAILDLDCLSLLPELG